MVNTPVKTEPASSARLSTPELRAATTGGGGRSVVTGQPPAPVPLVLPSTTASSASAATAASAAPSASAAPAASAAPSASAVAAASAAPSASAAPAASAVPPASSTMPAGPPQWIPELLWGHMEAGARTAAWTDAVRVASGAAVDADRDAAQRAADALLDEGWASEEAARAQQLATLRAARASNAQSILALDEAQKEQERRRSRLAAVLTADRRREDAIVELGRKAKLQRENDLRLRAERSARPSTSGRTSTAASAASSRTYAAAASSPVPVTRSTSARAGQLAFEAGDSIFSPAKLADVAQYHQFNFATHDSQAVRDLATETAIALPAARSIQEAVDVANTSRPDLRDLAGRLLTGMRRAFSNATAPVVYPGCHGPSSAAFQQPAPVRAKKPSASRPSRGGSSGEESGWSSASASGSRKKVAKVKDGAKSKGGTGSGSDTSLPRKPGRQR